MASQGQAPPFDRLRGWRSTWRTLSWSDRRLLLLAWLLLALIRFSLSVFGFRRTAARFNPVASSDLGPPRVVSDIPSARVPEVVRLLAIAARHTLIHNTCLHRSLTLCWLLHREGFECRLRLVTRRQNGRFEAHAWVEHGGVVVSGAETRDDEYVPLAWQHDA